MNEIVLSLVLQRLGYVLHNQSSAVLFPVKARDFSLSAASRPSLGPNKLLSRGLFRPGHEVDHSLPSNGRIKNAYCATLHTLRHTASWRFTDEQTQIYLTSNVDIIIVIVIIIIFVVVICIFEGRLRENAGYIIIIFIIIIIIIIVVIVIIATRYHRYAAYLQLYT